jgi:site-specific DNA recombinase
LEDIFHHQLKDFFFSTTEITNYLNQADQVIKEKEELLKTVRDEKKKTEQDMEKMYRAYTSGEISIEGFGRFYKPLEERLKQIDSQIPEIQGEIDFLKIQYLSSDQIFNEAKDLYSRWPQLTSEEKRKIIENITEKIVIGNEDVAIHLTYLPSSFELMAKGQQNVRGSWPQRA